MDDEKASNWSTPAGPDQRWVCGACGKSTPPGTPRTVLKDVSCMMHAVLCHATPITSDGRERRFLAARPGATMPAGYRFAVPNDACYPEDFL